MNQENERPRAASDPVVIPFLKLILLISAASILETNQVENDPESYGENAVIFRVEQGCDKLSRRFRYGSTYAKFT